MVMAWILVCLLKCVQKIRTVSHPNNHMESFQGSFVFIKATSHVARHQTSLIMNIWHWYIIEFRVKESWNLISAHQTASNTWLHLPNAWAGFGVTKSERPNKLLRAAQTAAGLPYGKPGFTGKVDTFWDSHDLKVSHPASIQFTVAW